MKYAVQILELVSVIYKLRLREIIKEAVEKSPNPFDDVIINVLDQLLGFSSK